MKMTLHSFAL